MKLDVAITTQDQFASYLKHDGRGKRDRLEYNNIKELHGYLDLDRYDEIRRALLSQGSLGSERKYLDLLYWVRSKLRIAIEQGLHEMPPRRLLDLGAGAGHFALLCKQFGHQVMTLDLGHIELYNELVSFFGVERVDFEIQPFVPLPQFDGKFDMVTGFMVGFNKRSKRELWGEAEWSFFLRDVAQNILDHDGRLVLKMIRNENLPGLHFGDPGFVSFIEAHGGTVDAGNGYVQFKDLTAFTE